MTMSSRGWSFRAPLSEVDIPRVLSEAVDAKADVITVTHRACVFTFVRREAVETLERHNLEPYYGALRTTGVSQDARIALYRGRLEFYGGSCTFGGRSTTNWLYVIVDDQWFGSERPAQDIAKALNSARMWEAECARTVVRVFAGWAVKEASS